MDKDQEFAKPAPEQKLFVGGHWLDGQEWFEVRDKLTGEVLAAVPTCEEELLEMAVQASYDIQGSLAARSGEERAASLSAWAKQLGARRSLLARLLHREAAVPVRWADVEIEQAVAVLLAAADEAARLEQEASGTDPGSRLSLRRPVGSVAVLLPARQALFRAAQLCGAAIAAGCPVVLLAHPLTPLSVIGLVESAQAANFPPGTINLVFGLRQSIGLKLAADPRVALLVTGGPAPDQEALASARGQRPRIQVGSGHGCAFLDRGADVASCVTALLARRFRNPRWAAGELAYVLCPEELTARLHAALGEGAVSLPGGHRENPDDVVPWQLTESAVRFATDWLDAITGMGGKVASGGRHNGLYVEPAVVTAPAGTRALPPPPAGAPFFVIDSYDKHPRAQLERFPDITEMLIFTPDPKRALELARLTDAERVDVIAPHSTGQVSPGPTGAADISALLAGMTRTTNVNLLYVP